ncbi:MAG TPA: 3'(2'),5'-bisphosphate nucleotidase [Bacteroidetes bacterium]|nr:3'(2'),5'-bisphosphate nucleotidase [Bacteroidota bacterium]
MTYSHLLPSVIEIAHAAGEIILKHFNSGTEASFKEDKSPLTAADLESNDYIVRQLAALTPQIPIISEETIPESFDNRRNWDTFWLVDPLDGTKEFVKRTGQFTVNIGLISQGKPVLGVIAVPVMRLRYYSAEGDGAYFENLETETKHAIAVRALDVDHIDIVASKDHAGPMVQALSDQFPNAGFKSMGSSLKFCLIAAGEADVYLRDVPTMEWDTAAAHAILLEAGGQIYTLDQKVLTYNKESLRNPSILTVADQSEFWFQKVKE